MKKFLIVFFGIVGLTIIGGISLIFGYVGFQNECNKYENGIIAQYDVNRNIYDNGYKSILEIASVPCGNFFLNSLAISTNLSLKGSVWISSGNFEITSW